MRKRYHSLCISILTGCSAIWLHASNLVTTDEGDESTLDPLSRLLQGTNQDQLSGAFAKLNDAIEANPNNAKFYEERAVIKGVRRDFRGAIEDATRAVEIDPSDSIAYKLRAWVRVISQDFSDAASDLDKAIELEPGDADAFYPRGRTRFSPVSSR